jgi:malonyl CoA-acyl carrier protein transacylase
MKFLYPLVQAGPARAHGDVRLRPVRVLLPEAGRGVMRSLLVFDGLGARTDSLISILRQQCSRSENAVFFHSVYRALDEVVDYLGPTTLPEGLPLEKWLGGLEPASLNSTAAGVCVHVLQLCQVQPTTAPADAVGALGHSMGLQAAIIAATRVRRLDEFFALAAASVKLVTVSLARAHEMVPPGRTTTAGPMAAITGLDVGELRAVLAAHPGVALGLINAPDALVVSGHAEALLRLRAAAPFARDDVDWTYLPNTIPFHSPLFAELPERIHADLAALGPLPAPDRLVLPVYAADVPRDLRDADDLVDEYLNQVFVRPIDWASAAQHAVTDSAADRLLDVGPGAGARRFTRACLRSGAGRMRFESLRPTR